MLFTHNNPPRFKAVSHSSDSEGSSVPSDNRSSKHSTRSCCCSGSREDFKIFFFSLTHAGTVIAVHSVLLLMPLFNHVEVGITYAELAEIQNTYQIENIRYSWKLRWKATSQESCQQWMWCWGLSQPRASHPLPTQTSTQLALSHPELVSCITQLVTVKQLPMREGEQITSGVFFQADSSNLPPKHEKFPMEWYG